MQQHRLYELQKHDRFVIKGNKVKIPQNCRLIKVEKYIKWYNPLTWFTKYYIYDYLGEQHDQ